MLVVAAGELILELQELLELVALVEEQMVPKEELEIMELQTLVVEAAAVDLIQVNQQMEAMVDLASSSSLIQPHKRLCLYL
jgi:hypothetical protein